MDKIYRVLTKMSIFGCWQKWSKKPVKETNNVHCIEYIKTADAKMKAEDIEEIESLLEEARMEAPDAPSESVIYAEVARRFNKNHF